MEKSYKKWLLNEYFKKKEPTLIALRSLSVDELLNHIIDYKQFILTFISDNEKNIVDANALTTIEKLIKQIEDMELLLSKGINNSLISIMFDEEKIVHAINKSKEDKKEGACCYTKIDV